jgi:hypothetical protein
MHFVSPFSMTRQLIILYNRDSIKRAILRGFILTLFEYGYSRLLLPNSVPHRLGTVTGVCSQMERWCIRLNSIELDPSLTCIL